MIADQREFFIANVAIVDSDSVSVGLHRTSEPHWTPRVIVVECCCDPGEEPVTVTVYDPSGV
jgi:hypothetical protein